MAAENQTNKGFQRFLALNVRISFNRSINVNLLHDAPPIQTKTTEPNRRNVAIANVVSRPAQF